MGVIRLNPRSGVLLGKLRITQLFLKFPAFYGIRWLIAVFTRTYH